MKYKYIFILLFLTSCTTSKSVIHDWKYDEAFYVNQKEEEMRLDSIEINTIKFNTMVKEITINKNNISSIEMGDTSFEALVTISMIGGEKHFRYFEDKEDAFLFIEEIKKAAEWVSWKTETTVPWK